MRIVLHCVYFPPEVGGLESHVYFLGRGLVERGHSVTVVTSRSKPGLAKKETLDGIDVIRTWLPARTPTGWTAHALCSAPATRRALDGADVVHAQAFPSILPCALGRIGRPIPLVATLHTSHFLRLAQRPTVRAGLRKLVDLPDHNLAASIEIARVAEGLGPGIRVEALANGVDTSLFQPRTPALPPTPGKVRLVAPRRLFAKNGVEFLIRALPAIVAQVEVELIVIGDGPERSRLDALVADLGLENVVRFLGAQPHGEMAGLLSSADLAVFPSLMEATSVAALESMACELPVAASRVGGLPEIVDDEVGTLFPPSDPEGLATAVVALLKTGELKRMGQKARARVKERWSNERLVDRHLEIYLGLRRRTGGRGHPGPAVGATPGTTGDGTGVNG